MAGLEYAIVSLKMIIDLIVIKGQIISECPLEILDFPKIPWKIWQISALESKKVVKS